MKNSSAIRSLLLISQVDMAKLLKVTRSQLSMFELGKRDLPRRAKLLLAPMLDQATKNSMKPSVEEDYPNVEKQERLKEMLVENKFERIRMQRKLEKVSNNTQKKQAVLHLVEFISNSAAHQSKSDKDLVAYIKDSTIRMYGGCNSTTVMLYKFKSELLELERQLLEQFFAKHTTI